ETMSFNLECAGLTSSPADSRRRARRLDLYEPPGGRRRGETAESRLAVRDRHSTTYLAHHVDHFVRTHREIAAGECHFGRGDCLHCGRCIPVDARDLDETTDRIADQTEHPLERERNGG